jgi:peptidoglycan/LPS O-acetylase OafA/YrhL
MIKTDILAKNLASMMARIKGFLLRHLSRESSSGQFIAEIDGLRFIAIMAVVLYHANRFTLEKSRHALDLDYLGILLSQGFFGVQLFFVISGFVIAYPFAKAIVTHTAKPRLKKYYFRRLTRLEPPYIFNLVLIFTLLVIVKGVPFGEYMRHLVASLFYQHNQVYGTGSLINYVAWSLEIECQFYLLAPLAVTVFRIKRSFLRRLILFSIIGVWSGVDAVYLTEYPRVVYSLAYYGNYFLVGFLLVDFYINDWQEGPTKRISWDFIGLSAWTVMAGLLVNDQYTSTLLPFLILVAYCGAFKGTYSNRFFRKPLIYVIGGMCYTIYLYHFYLISLIGRMSWSFVYQESRPIWGNIIMMVLVTVPPTIAASAFFFVIGEKPFMKRDWYKRVLRSRSNES